MQKSKVVIIDDEILSRNLLKEYLLDNENFELIAECKNGIEAVGVINAMQPDLIFLDIQMPGKTGFEVLEDLEYLPQIIFSTAFDAFAIRAFEVNAIDYLLKPFTKLRFQSAIEKVKINDKITINNQINLLETIQTKKYSSRVLVQKGMKLINILVNEIIYIEAQDDYALVYTANDSYLTNKGISAIHNKLNPDDFIRVHRSYVVGIHHIKEITKDAGGLQIETTNNKKINISRSYIDVVNCFRL